MAELTPEPGTSEKWKLHKVPQVKPGDAVITASSGRTLQNKEGDLTEIPNGLRVGWFPPAPDPKLASSYNRKELEAAFSALASIVNDIRDVLFEYNMIEAEDEFDPEYQASCYRQTTG